ncbi:DNA-directed DNA polymerase [Tanacetum coccineum]
MKKTRILTRLYGVTPTIVLRHNLFKARHITQQDHAVTIHKVYAVTLLLWKDKLSESALWRNMDTWLRCFGSIAGGLDHVNPVIRLPLECGISMVLGKDDHSNPRMSNAGQPEMTVNEYLTKQINAIRNFEKKSKEPLHLAWERFNDSLYNCPEHKINEQEQLQICYQGLDTETRRKVDFKGPIPRMTPAAGIEAIIELSKHSLSCINIPFIEALEQIPKYAKFIKDLLTRRGNETSKITLNERCSAVVLNKIPLNEKDARSFTIPCVIGQSGINKVLADLGSSISLIAYSIFLRLNLGELKPTHMCIELANKSTQIPKGVAENVIGKISRFVFPVDFVVLDMKEVHKITIVLGRPLLATAHAMIDVFSKKISFEVGNETITFDLEKSMRFPPSNDDTCHSIDIIDLSILDHISRDLEPKSEDYTKPTLFAANMFEGEKPTTKLKDLASHLEYAFLDNNQEFPVIISSLLSSQEKELLLGVLIKHKSALEWKVVDIKGISPSFCTHKILMEDSFKPVVQPQRRLNPKVQDVVKAEIVKLLDAGLIYAILAVHG